MVTIAYLSCDARRPHIPVCLWYKVAFEPNDIVRMDVRGSERGYARLVDHVFFRHMDADRKKHHTMHNWDGGRDESGLCALFCGPNDWGHTTASIDADVIW